MSRSECMSTPIELADMAVAQMDGCSTLGHIAANNPAVLERLKRLRESK